MELSANLLIVPLSQGYGLRKTQTWGRSKKRGGVAQRVGSVSKNLSHPQIIRIHNLDSFPYH